MTAHSLVVPAYSGASVTAESGTEISIVDVRGRQVGDLFAFVADDPRQRVDAAATRSACERLFPAVGESFITQDYRSVLTFVADTSPGVHDMLYAPCSAFEYTTVDGPHPSCRENLESVAASVGVPLEPAPDPVNLFQHTRVDADGTLEVVTPVSRPGDQVTLRAEADLVIILTACSYDLGVTNGDECTELRIDLDRPPIR